MAIVTYADQCVEEKSIRDKRARKCPGRRNEPCQQPLAATDKVEVPAADRMLSRHFRGNRALRGDLKFNSGFKKSCTEEEGDQNSAESGKTGKVL